MKINSQHQCKHLSLQKKNRERNKAETTNPIDGLSLRPNQPLICTCSAIMKIHQASWFGWLMA
jgi:hypothetical protein